jgi:hypothetical protein
MFLPLPENETIFALKEITRIEHFRVEALLTEQNSIMMNLVVFVNQRYDIVSYKTREIC